MNRFGRVYIRQMAASSAKSYKLTIAVRFIPLYIKDEFMYRNLTESEENGKNMGFFSRCCADIGFRRGGCSVRLGMQIATPLDPPLSGRQVSPPQDRTERMEGCEIITEFS